MRLPLEDRTAILAVIKSFVGPTTEVRLCGSRVHDAERGGDIDLLLIMPSASESSAALDQKHALLFRLKDAIGDQRIDLTVTTKSRIQGDPVLQSMHESSIEI